ncbi:hypothetical protein BCR34DRAFT_561361 [Clohesyomyces aquaticus]|uniref:Uncharacterized protein n=1 Tax=Clohesyomyces aquaticus TaxID=1231657 RepID=A0A1Y1ZU63_9PLEO|nr:hypothetical protein BCR34DRAFT_561361 [Clohesyomyces aquaticus]
MSSIPSLLSFSSQLQSTPDTTTPLNKTQTPLRPTQPNPTPPPSLPVTSHATNKSVTKMRVAALLVGVGAVSSILALPTRTWAGPKARSATIMDCHSGFRCQEHILPVYRARDLSARGMPLEMSDQDVDYGNEDEDEEDYDVTGPNDFELPLDPRDIDFLIVPDIDDGEIISVLKGKKKTNGMSTQDLVAALKAEKDIAARSNYGPYDKPTEGQPDGCTSPDASGKVICHQGPPDTVPTQTKEEEPKKKNWLLTAFCMGICGDQ